MMNLWSPTTWRLRPARHVPDYSDPAAVAQVRDHLSTRLPLVSLAEIRRLRQWLGRVAAGDGFLLQGGDCAETFADCTSDNVRQSFDAMTDMAAALSLRPGWPVVKVGRIAGQFAKPRSEPAERRGTEELPTYRGDIINDAAFTAESRAVDPQRMLTAYHQSASTLNMLRSLATNADAHLGSVADFIVAQKTGRKNPGQSQDPNPSMIACPVSENGFPSSLVEIFTSHEALLLEYEEGLVRRDDQAGTWFASSAHMLWIGERTRQLDGAHVEFARGIENPIGVKCSAQTDEDDLLRLTEALNPHNATDRLVLIVRMGASNIARRLPRLVQTVERAGRNVLWLCDPMHGNTFKLSNGYKTRDFESVLAEATMFFKIIEAEGANPGGLHLEMTGLNVTECLGGPQNIKEDQIGDRYLTSCDPRLNREQAVTLASVVAQHLRRQHQIATAFHGSKVEHVTS